MYWLAIIGALLVFFIFGFDVGVYRKRKEKGIVNLT